MSLRPSALIFDMDGVIADSEPIHIRTERETFLPYGISLSDDELCSFVGSNLQVVVKTVVARYRIRVDADRLFKDHKASLLKNMQDGLQPIDGSLDLIRALSGTAVPLAVASSSFMDLIRLVLRKFQIESCFHSVVCGDDVHRSKPHPDIFLETARRLGLPPEECLVIEDSTNGIKAAKAARMACIGLRSPNSHNQDLSGADRTADDFHAVRSELVRSFGFVIG